MASVQANGDALHRRRDLNVLVTGFGPFQDKFPVNPSFEITRLLSPLPPLTTPDGNVARIISYGQPIRVCYTEVRELVPVLHESFLGTVDLVVHIGMASGRHVYTAELNGHRDGYTTNKDLDGKTVPEEDGLERFGDCPPTMTTSLDYDEIVRRWKASIASLPEDSPAAGADCRPSENAGHYLCDYVYFNSLAWFGRRNGNLGGCNSRDRPVLFFHVPADSAPEALEKGREVAIALIGAMVDVFHKDDESGETVQIGVA